MPNSRLQRILVTFMVLWIASLPAFGQSRDIVILHTNDLHGESLAKIATMVEELRITAPDLLLLDAGDLFSGTPVSSMFHGEAEETSVLTLGYDALALGNHDFDFGLDALQRSLERGVPWLAANVLKRDGTALVTPFILKKIRGVRILIVGLTTPSTPKMSFARNVEGLVFADPSDTLRDILDGQEGGYEICIVLSHLGYGDDLLLAQRVPGITVIIGGHSHTTLSRPVRIGNTLITQSGSSGRYLGKIVISTEGAYKAQGELLEVQETTPLHPDLQAIDDFYGAALSLEMAEPLGFAPRGFTKNGMGLLLIQALLDFSGADAALYNAGGVRSGLPQGTISKRDIFAVEPFGNEAIMVRLSGPEFAELFAIKSGRGSDYYQGPRLIDLDLSYTIATSDFLAGEDSNYPMLAQGEIIPLGLTVRQVLQHYVQERILDPIKKEGAL